MTTDTAPPETPPAGDTDAPGLAEGTLRFNVKGMTCASCVRRVERALSGVEGVEGARVNLATEEATVDLADRMSLEVLREAVDRAGYDLVVTEGDEEARDQLEAERRAEYETLKRKTIFAGSVAIFLVGYMALTHFVRCWTTCRAASSTPPSS